MGEAGSWQKGGGIRSLLQGRLHRWGGALTERSVTSGRPGCSPPQLSIFSSGKGANKDLLTTMVHCKDLKRWSIERICIHGVPKMIETCLLILHGFQNPILTSLLAPRFCWKEERVCSPWPCEPPATIHSGLWWQKRNWPLLPFLDLWFLLALFLLHPTRIDLKCQTSMPFSRGQPRGQLDQMPLHLPCAHSDDPPTYLTAREMLVGSDAGAKKSSLHHLSNTAARIPQVIQHVCKF